MPDRKISIPVEPADPIAVMGAALAKCRYTRLHAIMAGDRGRRDTKAEMEADAKAAIEALRAAGYAIVPREPTTEMIAVGAAECFGGTSDDEAAHLCEVIVQDAYMAMIDAASGRL